MQHNPYRFSDFHLDPDTRQLWRDGALQDLKPKYLEVLMLLVDRAGSLVTKDELFEKVWPDSHVSDASLTQCIKDIRKCLGDQATQPTFIRTIPKRGYMFVAAVEAGTPPPTMPRITQPLAARPYKFLQSYSEDDAPVFWGRDREIAEISSKIVQNPSYVIYGQSGVGKTSLLQAGIVPTLKAAGHRTTVLRCFPDPASDLEAALYGANPEREPSVHAALTQLAGASPNAQLVFCFDQFEAWLHLADGDRKRRLVTLIEAMQAGAFADRLHFVFNVREDFFAEMDQLKAWFPAVFHAEFRLGPMSRAKAARLIMEPAERAGCRFEDGLVPRMLHDLSRGEVVELPALQVVCDRLYDARDPNGDISNQHYESLGRAGNILAHYLDRVLQRFQKSDLALARETLLALTEEGSASRLLPLRALSERVTRVFPTETDQLQRLVEELAAARILSIHRSEGEGWVGLMHDFLVPSIQRWVTEEQRKSRQIHRVYTRALANFGEHGLLPGEEELALLLDHAAEHRLHESAVRMLVRACLRYRRVPPEALITGRAEAMAEIENALHHQERWVRETACLACYWLPEARVAELLPPLALSGRLFTERRVAATVLARRFGPRSLALLKAHPMPGLLKMWRYLVCGAVIRDADQDAFALRRQSPWLVAGILVMLAGVRLRRDRERWIQQTVGGTIGATVSGGLYGLGLAFAVAYLKPNAGLNLVSLALALAGLGAAMGYFAGFGLTAVASAAAIISRRHHRYWRFLGGFLGGASMGGVFHLVADAVCTSLFGRADLALAGWFQGGMLGAGAVLGSVWLKSRRYRDHRRRVVALSALGAGIAGSLACLTTGLTFVVSLENLIAAFTHMPQVRAFLPLGTDEQWLLWYKAALGFSEGLSLGGGLSLGMSLMQTNREQTTET